MLFAVCKHVRHAAVTCVPIHMYAALVAALVAAVHRRGMDHAQPCLADLQTIVASSTTQSCKTPDTLVVCACACAGDAASGCRLIYGFTGLQSLAATSRSLTRAVPARFN